MKERIGNCLEHAGTTFSPLCRPLSHNAQRYRRTDGRHDDATSRSYDRLKMSDCLQTDSVHMPIKPLFITPAVFESG